MSLAKMLTWDTTLRSEKILSSIIKIIILSICERSNFWICSFKNTKDTLRKEILYWDQRTSLVPILKPLIIPPATCVIFICSIDTSHNTLRKKDTTSIYYPEIHEQFLVQKFRSLLTISVSDQIFEFNFSLLPKTFWEIRYQLEIHEQSSVQ